MFAFNSANSAAKALVYATDKTNYYSNLQLDGFDNPDISDPTSRYRYARIVSPDTVIPTLYRYYKENFSVKIYDCTSGTVNLIQLFDINTEGKVYVAAAKTAMARTAEDITLLSIYNDPDGVNSNIYLFEAPWIGDTIKHTKKRIDLFVKGEAGYVNNVYVDYTTNNLKNYLGTKDVELEDHTHITVDKYIFEETFIKYTFTGDTISVGEGEEIETLTGNKQPEDKIDIVYRIYKNEGSTAHY